MAASRIRGITVEINGSTTGLDKALKGVNSSISQTQRALKDVNRLLKIDPGNTELLVQKQRMLKEAVSETKGKLETLKLAAEQANDALANGDISQDQYDALQREIIETEQRLQDLERQARESASVLGTQMQEAGAKMQEIGGKVGDIGKKLLPVTGAVAAVGTAAGKMASEFEDAMAKVSTIADTTEVPIGELERAILDLSNQTGISSSEIANNVYDAISAGQKTGDAVNFVEKATKLAKAGFADSGAALDILTTTMNAYGLEAEEVTRVSDVLINTQNLGKTTVADLASSMGKVIPTAKANGVSIENLAGMYAVMTSNGIATAESTTYMNSMLNELGKQGTTSAVAFAKGTEHIKKGGLTMAEAMESGWALTDVLATLDEQAYVSGTTIGNMFSSAEAGKAASVLWDNAEKLNSAVGQMGNSAGATDEAFGKLDTTSYKVQKTVNELKNTAIELGQQILEVLAPIIEEVSRKVHEFAERFSGLSDSQKKAVLAIGLIAAAIGPLLIVIGMLVSSVGTVVGAIGSLMTFVMGLTPAFLGTAAAVAGIIAVVAVLAAAFVDLWKNNEEFRNKIIAIWDGIRAKIDEFVEGIVERVNALGIDFEGSAERLKNIWKGLCEFLAPIFESAFQLISDIFGGVLDILLGAFDVFAGIFTGNWDQALQGVQEIFRAAWNFIVNTFDNVLNLIVELADTVLGWFGSSWKEAWNAVGDFFKELWNGIVSFFTGIWDGIASFVSEIWETIGNAVQVGIMLVGEIMSAAFQIITLPFQLVWQQCRDFVLPVWEDIKKIVSDALDAVGEWIGSKMEAARSVFETVMTAISNITGMVWNTVSSVTSTVWTAVSNFLTKIFDKIKKTVSEAFNSVKKTVTDAMEKVKSVLYQKMQDAYNKVSGVLGNIKNKFSSIFEDAKNIVKDAIEKIKGFFNFSWELPKLKMPHFKIDGGFSLNPPSVPHFSVEWYRKAMDEAYILKGASIFGQMNGKFLGGGEAGSEIVAGTRYMMDLIREATAQSNQSVAQAVIGMEDRIVNIMSEYFPLFVEKGETERYINLDPHFSVMVGNRQFDDYIVRTAEKGISGRQRDYRKAKGAG